jgi:2-dehydro-3-deoxyphosphogluconate aldolase/(4S)-4-hydroxy-2-oxoglutarate aldolase
MAEEKEMTLIERIKKHQLMVAVRTDLPEKAYYAAKACIEGGVKFIEITFSVPDAGDVIKKLSSDDRAAVGAGTVLSVSEAREALRAGAAYIVSPNFDERVVKFTKKEGAVSIPGACTPTEIYKAYTAGGDIIKLFPFVEIGGLGFLKTIRGPFPYIKYMLCGGVTMDNISEYLTADAAGILVGSAIIRHELVSAGDWGSITDLSTAFTQKIEVVLAGKRR